METQKPLLKDEDGEEVDVHMYRSMIGSLLYLTSSIPNIMFAVCACARYQVNPKVSHLHVVKSDYAGASLDRKSTTGGKAKKSVKLMMEKLFRMELKYALMVNPSIYISCIEQFWSTGVVKTVSGEVQLHALVDGKKIIISEASVKRDLKLDDEEGTDCLPNSTIFEQIELMGYEKISQKLTFYKPFFSPQWKFLIHTILQCLSPKTTTWNEFSSTMAPAIICLATNQNFNFSKFIFEGMIRNLDNVSGKFLMYPRKPKRKDTQVPQPSDPSDNVADEAVHKELGDSLGRRINAIDADEDITLVNVQDDADNKMFDVDALNGEEVFVAVQNENVVEKDDIQAKIDVDYQLAKRLQAQEQEELSVEENAKLFQQLLEQRRKHFAAKSAEEKRNKPPTQAQQRKIICTYLKNMEGKKIKDLKNKSFDSIQKMFDRAFKKLNTFVDFRADLVEDEEEVAIDAVPLATKSPKIVVWKIHKEGKKSYYQIVRADGKSQMYMIFSQMLKSFNTEDLEDLYKLVKARYGSTRPVESMDYLLWNDLKTMFEPHVEDAIWRNQQGYKVLEWKLYDSCRVHSLMMQSMQIYMLGRIVGIKSLLNAASITAAHIRVNAAQGVNAASEEVSTAELVINAADGVNAASEEVSTAELVSTAYVIYMSYLCKRYA
ncbi:hypothetical protein Tco_0328035 [Tanacetum coccineum]